MSNDTERMRFAVSLMSNDKIAELIKIAIEELNQRKEKENG